MADEGLLVQSLRVPAQISCLACIEVNRLFAGSDDGSVRVYDLSTFKVAKAVRCRAPVSSVVWQQQKGWFWIASGRSVLAFAFHTDKLVLTSSDALVSLTVGSDDDDVVNELAIDAQESRIAFCLDSGRVGVIDLSNNEVKLMRRNHNSLSGSVRFIPHRPNELVSGGYDSALLHFDTSQGSLLSCDDLIALAPSTGIAMSPPFILSLSVSPSAIVAAGTADGRIYIGMGGEKSTESVAGRQGRRRKWDGLRSDGRIVAEVASGPVAALAFISPREFLTCTLLGSLASHEVCRSISNGKISVKTVWNYHTKNIFKVNAMVTSGNLIIIGGFEEDGRGVIEIWSKSSIDASETATKTD